MDSPPSAGVCLVEMNSSSSTTTLTVKEDIPLLNKPRETNNIFNRFDAAVLIRIFKTVPVTIQLVFPIIFFHFDSPLAMLPRNLNSDFFSSAVWATWI